MSEEPKQDVKKLIRVRGGHRAAFTRLERKLDEFFAHPIDDSERLCEAQALLSTLKNKSSDIHRWDHEIELLIEDENELLAEMETTTDFDHNASITVARLSALISNYHKSLESINNPPRYESSGRNTSKLKLPKLELPTFTGSYTDWMSFIDLFRASVNSNSQLTNSEKLNYLRACLKGDAAKLISSITITDANYTIARQLLQERYENKRSIVQAHLQIIWSQPSMKMESSTGLRKILETTNEHLRALAELGQPVEHWDSFLVFWLTDKMDIESRKQWQLDHPGTDLLTWAELAKFLDTRSRALETGSIVHKSIPNSTNQPPWKEKRIQSYSVVTCSDCDPEHKLHACPEFKKMSVRERFQIAKSKQVCFNCLQQGHNANSCSSKFKCRECKQKHHTLLHWPQQTVSDSPKSSKKKENDWNRGDQMNTMTNNHCSAQVPPVSVLLATALVSIRDSKGKPVQLRAMLDSGSQASFITSDKARALMLSMKKTSTTLTPLGAGTTQRVNQLLATKLNDSIDVNMFILPKITNHIPSHEIDISQMRHIRNLNMADPQFNVPSTIDVLLGADVVEEVMLDNRIKDNGVYLRQSIFGSIVSGPIKTTTAEVNYFSCHVITTPTTDSLLGKFWALEEVPARKLLTLEETQCEEHFLSTTKRNHEGRFVVRMPFKGGEFKLSLSKNLAMRRFLNLERKLKRDPELQKRYSDFITEFIDLGHMEKVPNSELNNPQNFCLPHRCVFKEDSSTTKLRVVFDASAKTTSGFSLNDCLMVGPKLQDDLFDILIRFRFFKVAMSADVAKMYRQVELQKCDRDFHRILWRFSGKKEIETFRMTRVTYGVASSSFHSIRFLSECGNFETTPKEVKEALQRDFYVDDILTGASSASKAKELQTGLIFTLKQAQFDLRKCVSSYRI